MQPRQNTTVDIGPLFERVRCNRSALRASAMRLVRTLGEVEETRSTTARLRREVRQGLDDLAERLVDGRQHCSPDGRQPATRVLPRYHPTEPDDLDTIRQRLHEAYVSRRDPEIRDELMATYDGFARSLAVKYRHRESIDDLFQVARIGLLHAIDRFDPSLGRPFPLFARITITGELKRHIRDKTWAMRVPRSLQEDYLTVMRAVDELTAERSDSPSMEALEARCGMSLERVVEALELRVSQRALSIDLSAGTAPEDFNIELGQEDFGFRRLEDRQLLAGLLDRLSERDRHIIELRFIDELTQTEIAEKVGVSQMCVSRVLARTIGRLRLWARTAVA